MNECICCGSVAKLKVCCNGCYQDLKLKAEKLNKLEKWLDERIEASEKYSDTQEEAFYFRQVKEAIENGKQ